MRADSQQKPAGVVRTGSTMITALSVFFLVRIVTFSDQNPLSVSLSELSKNHEKYHGKMVTVRGSLHVSMHGVVLANEQCFKKGSRYKAFEKGAAINLETPGGDVEPDVPIAQFDMDTESSELFLELAQTKMRRGTSIGVSLTCTGLIRSQSEFQRDGDAATGYRGNGFGHMGIYPAELVVKSIKDVEVKQVSN